MREELRCVTVVSGVPSVMIDGITLMPRWSAHKLGLELIVSSFFLVMNGQGILDITTDSVAFQGAFFGPGDGQIILKGIDCSGDEERLLDCPTNDHEILNCTHARDAAVACSRMYHLNHS